MKTFLKILGFVLLMGCAGNAVGFLSKEEIRKTAPFNDAFNRNDIKAFEKLLADSPDALEWVVEGWPYANMLLGRAMYEYLNRDTHQAFLDVLLQSPKVKDLIRQGRIPNPLCHAAKRALDRNKKIVPSVLPYIRDADPLPKTPQFQARAQKLMVKLLDAGANSSLCLEDEQKEIESAATILRQHRQQTGEMVKQVLPREVGEPTRLIGQFLGYIPETEEEKAKIKAFNEAQETERKKQEAKEQAAQQAEQKRQQESSSLSMPSAKTGGLGDE